MRTCTFMLMSKGVMASIMPGAGWCSSSGEERHPRMSVMLSAVSMSREGEMAAEAAMAREIMKEAVFSLVASSRMKMEGFSTCRSKATLGPKKRSQSIVRLPSSTSFSSSFRVFLGIIAVSFTTLRTTALAMSMMSYIHAVGTTFSAPTATLTFTSSGSACFAGL